jgi:dipeptidyl aminopeptidase/acylaminoacyl peptidase
MKRSRLLLPLIAALALFPISTAGTTGYQKPPAELAKIVDAPLTPIVRVSPDRSHLLLLERPALPPIRELAEPELRLAGLRINPATHGPSRAASFHGMTLVATSDGRERRVEGLPDEPRIRNVAWSPDGRQVAFTLDLDSSIELWMASVKTSRAMKLAGVAVHDVFPGDPFQWLSSSEALLVRTVPDEKTGVPAESAVPAGPIIQENLGRTTPARTYQDLLRNPHDEALFDYYGDAQLVRVSLDGTVTDLGQRGILREFDSSPDGRFILLQTLRRPYSYLVPHFRFPRRIEVLDSSGELVKRLVDLPLQDEIPLGFGSVPTGMRNVGWRSDAPATLYWVEALDEGNARKAADERDRLFMLEAPFDAEPNVLATIPLRASQVYWGRDGLALISEWWWSDRKARVYAVDPSGGNEAKEVIFDYSFEDRYNDPGTPMTVPNQYGRSVLLLDRDGSFYLTGAGASAEGDRPFLRRYDRKKGKTTEMFRSRSPHYERPIAFLDDRQRVVLTSRESSDEPPNYYARDLRRGSVRALTRIPHPYPELEAVQKEFIQYEREDGVGLSAMLYLPAGYDAESDGPLPAFVWAYPNEYKSADAAGQVQDSPHRFKWISYWGPIPWVTRGYAVFHNTAMPVVGEGDEEPNDSFVNQLNLNARAVIDEGVRRGVVDPERVAIGGHSYGAFMTANLLAHTDMFRAGIARSGAYNRSLTPFGFQAEERTFWEAPEVYFNMSPFMNAGSIDEPILLIHGEADNNSGTFPMQSERLYDALKGLGKTTRLVMLPHESHGYRSYESVMHMMWEMDRWLETYVKTVNSEQ